MTLSPQSLIEQCRTRFKQRPSLDKQRKAFLAALAVALCGTIIQLCSRHSTRVAGAGLVIEIVGLLPLGIYAATLIPRSTMKLFALRWTPRSSSIVPTTVATDKEDAQ
jgi:hypothetical protein